MLSKKQQVVKRLFDILISFLGLLIFLAPISILILLASITTNKFGLFSQDRVGQHGQIFKIYKIRTMKDHIYDDFISLKDDDRITTFGSTLRKYKLDELPQLFNVLSGRMSLVGPRPDVKGYADELTGEDRVILSVKPGITGPATIKFRNEDILLSLQPDPKAYNDEVIWKEKVRINKAYIENWTFFGDIKYIYVTIFT